MAIDFKQDLNELEQVILNKEESRELVNVEKERAIAEEGLIRSQVAAQDIRIDNAVDKINSNTTAIQNEEQRATTEEGLIQSQVETLDIRTNDLENRTEQNEEDIVLAQTTADNAGEAAQTAQGSATAAMHEAEAAAEAAAEKYTKPETGIPETDLDDDVRVKLNKIIGAEFVTTHELSSTVGEETEIPLASFTIAPTAEDIGKTVLFRNETETIYGHITEVLESSAKVVTDVVQAFTVEVFDNVTITGAGTTASPRRVSQDIVEELLRNSTNITALQTVVASNQTEIAGLETEVNTKYSKPTAGIPESDLSAEVQEKLDNGGGDVSMKLDKQKNVDGRHMFFDYAIQDSHHQVEVGNINTVNDNGAVITIRENDIFLESVKNGITTGSALYVDGTSEDVLVTRSKTLAQLAEDSVITKKELVGRSPLLIPGANITLTPNQQEGTLTISASGQISGIDEEARQYAATAQATADSLKPTIGEVKTTCAWSENVISTPNGDWLKCNGGAIPAKYTALRELLPAGLPADNAVAHIAEEELTDQTVVFSKGLFKVNKTWGHHNAITELQSHIDLGQWDHEVQGQYGLKNTKVTFRVSGTSFTETTDLKGRIYWDEVAQEDSAQKMEHTTAVTSAQIELNKTGLKFWEFAGSGSPAMIELFEPANMEDFLNRCEFIQILEDADVVCPEISRTTTWVEPNKFPTYIFAGKGQ